jgi:hypothetical protein
MIAEITQGFLFGVGFCLAAYLLSLVIFLILLATGIAPKA